MSFLFFLSNLTEKSPENDKKVSKKYTPLAAPMFRPKLCPCSYHTNSTIWQVIAIQSHNRIDSRSIKDYSWPLLTTAKGVFYTQKVYLTIRLILVMHREKKSMFLQWLYEKEASKTKLIRARQQLVSTTTIHSCRDGLANQFFLQE